MFRIVTTLLALSLLSPTIVLADTAVVSLLERHLQAGTLPTCERELAELLKKNPKDPQARYGLGTIQFLHAVEGLAQDLHRYGFMQTSWIARGGPLIGDQLPLPPNPKPEQIDYLKSRKIYQDFVTRLEQAEATLALVDSPDVKLPVHFGLIRLDLNGDGSGTDDESLWKIYERMNRGARVQEAQAKQFVITFDAGDVLWLRGYCHLLMGLSETLLAYDFQELFERCGHILFANVKSPYPFLPIQGKEEFLSYDSIVDLIAMIHLINFPVAEPKRMASALQHLESMVDVSSKSWDLILAETDDDNEWIPNPKQTGVIPNVKVTDEMIASWRHFLSEARDILQGKTLVPFWRAGAGQGVNMRKIFTEPRRFDLVLWLQGTDVAPFLQEGKVTDPEVWQRLNRVFGGEFIGFAFWFN